MAMTNARSTGTDESFDAFMFHLMLQQTVSSPGFVSDYQVETPPLNLFFTDRQYIWFLVSDDTVKRPITPREQLTLISAFFGFSKSKLAEVFGVTRQAIFNWCKNDEPDYKHCEKIKRLAEVAFEVDPKPSQQIFHVYTNDVIEGYEKSLFDYIRDDDFDKNTVVKLSRTLYEMSKERWKRIDAMPKAKYGQNDLTILDYNLGFVEEERLGMK